MAFFVNGDRRIIDLERQLQFVPAGSGSDGTHEFILRGADFEVSFWAHREVSRVEGADAALPAPLRTLVTWEVAGVNSAHCTSREGVMQMIGETLTAYKFAHGGPVDQLVEVQFTQASARR